MARFVEGKGVRFKGRIYETWPLLSKALLKDGQEPNKWIEKNQNKARKAFSIGLNKERVPVKVTDKGRPVGQARKAAADRAADAQFITSARASIVASLKANIDGFDETTEDNQALIDRIFTLTKSDPDNDDAFIDAFLVDEKVETFLPGYTALARNGVIQASGAEAGRQYWLWRTSVNESYESHFGQPMSPAQLGAVAKEGHTAEYMDNYYSFRDTVGDEYRRRNPTVGEAVTNEALDALFKTGKSVETILAEYRGIDFIAANRGDIQGTAGAFNFGAGGAGPGAFSEEELKALGEQEAGITTELGLDMQRRVATATQRMSRIWQGQSVQGAVSLPGGATRGAPGSRVDVGA